MKKFICTLLLCTFICSLPLVSFASSMLLEFPTVVQTGNPNTTLGEVYNEVILQAKENMAGNTCCPQNEYSDSDVSKGYVPNYPTLYDILRINGIAAN